jgi:hypothetical protein
MLFLKSTVTFKGEPRIFIFEDDKTKKIIMKGKLDVINTIKTGVTIGGVSMVEDLWVLPTHFEYSFENDFYETDGNGIIGLTPFAYYCMDFGLRQLLVPEVVNGKPLLSLEESCFQNLIVYFVELPNSLMYIKDKAFRNCPIVSIKMPNMLREIGNNAFECCFDLRNVELNSDLRKLGDYVFSNCADLREIELPNSLIEVGKGIFSGIPRIKVFVNAPKFNLDNLDVSRKQIIFNRVVDEN